MDERESFGDSLNFSPMRIILILLIIIAVPYITYVTIEVGVGQGWFMAALFLFIAFIIYQIGTFIAGIALSIFRED